jgi:hypothetical protein
VRTAPLAITPVCWILAVAAASAQPTPATPLRTISASEAMPGVRDYGFLWWADGWRGRSPQGQRVLCVRTGHYGLAIDVEHLKVLHLGSIAEVKPAAEAAAEDNATVFALPPAELRITIRIGDTKYRCVGVDFKGAGDLDYPVRLIESGPVLQRFDLQRLVFEDEKKNRLDLDARLEIVAWPHELRLLLETTPRRDFPGVPVGVQVRLVGPGVLNRTHSVGSGSLSLFESWRKGVTDSEGIDTQYGGTNGPISVSVTATRPDGHRVPTEFLVSGHRVELPTESWSAAKDLDHLERIKLLVKNPSDGEVTVPIRFTKDESFEGITGMCPMLRDTDGFPTGIPVQVSKNWHQAAGRTLLNQGPWFHGSSLLRMPPRSRLELEFALTYARWGGVPGASQAQLCLIGWGVNQRWDQTAIGSWGESICYDADVCLNRSMIDDIRPLNVWAMSQQRAKWSWTNNVGGGDFLVYEDAAGKRQYLSRMRADYARPGPNLTEATYAGITPDGRIAARITVGTPRTDDLNRSYHRFRYDVLAPTPFRRLAFYQMGADNYNDHQFRRMARGNAGGLIEEWTPAQGGKRYSRPAIPCAGDAPWFSLHRAKNGDTKGGAWANRALVVRHWKARLGGRDQPTPTAAVFGTDNGVPSASVELVPPAGLTELKPGDFVEGQVEFVVIPMSSDDYYGSNQALRNALREGGDTWKMAHREAVGNHLKVEATRGRVVRRAAPVEVAVAGLGGAEVAITGGLGYVPVTFSGLSSYRGFTLWRDDGDGRGPRLVDQSVHGRDFWQADFDPGSHTWSLTYNLPLDPPDGRPRTVRLDLRPAL